MVRLTRMADYAIVLMHQMATAGVRALNSGELAGETGVPRPTTTKVLKALARAGLLSSSRGMKGGYTLAYSALDISVADIIAAVEGPIALTDCIEDAPGACELESCCQVRDTLQVVNDTVRRALREVSLADLVAPVAFTRTTGARWPAAAEPSA
jgi:FeS assembly SUF system regulator